MHHLRHWPLASSKLTNRNLLSRGRESSLTTSPQLYRRTSKVVFVWRLCSCCYWRICVTWCSVLTPVAEEQEAKQTTKITPRGTPTPAPMATAFVVEDLSVFVPLRTDNVVEGVPVCVLPDSVVEAAVEVEELGITPIVVTAEGVPTEQNKYHLHRT
jgi:hypothetical protein